MSDKSDSPQPDTRTDAQKFEDAMRAIITAPKKEVVAQLAEEKEARKKQRTEKAHQPPAL